MIKRIAPVVVAGVSLIGCAAPAPSEEVAMEPELAQTWQALTVFECQAQNAECVLEAGISFSGQAACATELTDCIVAQAVDSTETIVGCGFEDVGCTLEATTNADLTDLVDCQQAVLDCTVGEVDALTGVDLSDITEPVNVLVDEVASDAEELVDGTIDNVLTQIDCNVAAAECLSGVPFWDFAAVRECRVAFVDCSAAVVEDAVNDVVDIVVGSQECGAVYDECRDNGGSVRECAAAQRACETADGE